MKIVTANGKKSIKMSRSEWEAIGKKAGWKKQAQQQAVSGFYKRAKPVLDLVSQAADWVGSGRMTAKQALASKAWVEMDELAREFGGKTVGKLNGKTVVLSPNDVDGRRVARWLSENLAMAPAEIARELKNFATSLAGYVTAAQHQDWADYPETGDPGSMQPVM